MRAGVCDGVACGGIRAGTCDKAACVVFGGIGTLGDPSSIDGRGLVALAQVKPRRDLS